MTREELLNSIFDTMQQMHRFSNAKLHTLVKREGISPSQMELMAIVKHRQPVSSKDIAACLHLTAGAITQLLDSLVSQGYIERREDTRDRRVTNLSLSTAGVQKLQALWEHRKQALKDIMHTLSTEELSVMLRVQQKMLQHMQTELTKTNQQGK